MFWKKQPPPPPKKAWVNPSLIMPIIFAVIVGLAGLVWNGMAADIKTVQDKVEAVEKEKATNADVKEAIKELKDQTKEQNVAIQQNQIAIKELLIRQDILKAPEEFKIVDKEVIREEKKILTPEQFERYLSMKPEVKVKYKIYLEKRGYDVNDLPDK